MDTEALIADSLHNLVQQRNVTTAADATLAGLSRVTCHGHLSAVDIVSTVANMRRYMQVADEGGCLTERGQLMEVSREQAETLDLSGDVPTGNM